MAEAKKKTITSAKKTSKEIKKAPKKIAPKKVVKEKVEPMETLSKVEDENATSTKKAEYLYGVGRRKTAIAQVRVYKKGTGEIIVNDKQANNYFPTLDLQDRLLSPLKVVGQVAKLDITVKVIGGGSMSQAEAVRHGISRALLLLNPNFKKPLKKAGYLTRDSRKKERKKPGLKRARKAPQWKKR